MKEYIMKTIVRDSTLTDKEYVFVYYPNSYSKYQQELNPGTKLREIFNITVVNKHPVTDTRQDCDDNLSNTIISAFMTYGERAYDNNFLTRYCKKHSGMKHLKLVITTAEKYYVFNDKKGIQHTTEPVKLKRKEANWITHI